MLEAFSDEGFAKALGEARLEVAGLFGFLR
jgi:hypothetical protein